MVANILDPKIVNIPFASAHHGHIGSINVFTTFTMFRKPYFSSFALFAPAGFNQPKGRAYVDSKPPTFARAEPSRDPIFVLPRIMDNRQEAKSLPRKILEIMRLWAFDRKPGLCYDNIRHVFRFLRVDVWLEPRTITVVRGLVF